MKRRYDTVVGAFHYLAEFFRENVRKAVSDNLPNFILIIDLELIKPSRKVFLLDLAKSKIFLNWNLVCQSYPLESLV